LRDSGVTSLAWSRTLRMSSATHSPTITDIIEAVVGVWSALDSGGSPSKKGCFSLDRSSGGNRTLAFEGTPAGSRTLAFEGTPAGSRTLAFDGTPGGNRISSRSVSDAFNTRTASRADVSYLSITDCRWLRNPIAPIASRITTITTMMLVGTVRWRDFFTSGGDNETAPGRKRWITGFKGSALPEALYRFKRPPKRVSILRSIRRIL